MSWTPKERDDIKAALVGLFDFYDKKLNEQKLKFWLEDLGGLAAGTALKAISESRRRSEYFPKPAIVLKIASEFGMHSQDYGKPVADLGKPSEPEIASAWITYNKRIHGWSFGEAKVKQTWEEVLTIVNREAFKFNMPESLQPEHRIDSVWEASF